jgi:Outer membrane receptor proteins, mostly Fe transport
MIDMILGRCALIAAPFILPIGAPARAATPLATRPHLAANVDVTGTVTDSTNGQPLQSAEIAITREAGGIVGTTSTDAFGRFTIHNLAAGRYTLSAHLLGFRPVQRSLEVGATSAPLAVSLTMTPIGLNLDAVQIVASVPISVDTRTGDQVFKQNDFHGAPTNTTSQILQQSIAGAVRAPTGEVHIRGQHAEYTYYVDGVPVPPGISGSLNELFDPSVVNQINFQTGGWDAEYGGRNAAVINVTTKVPAGGFHGSVSSYVGAFDGSSTSGPTSFNGQSFSASTNRGRWGVFLSAGRQMSNMRLDPVVMDSSSTRVDNFHNNGTDYFGFGKVQYTPGTRDVFDLELNASSTHLAVPFDSSGGAFQNDHQRDMNGFVNLGWRHRFGDPGVDPAGRSNLFAGLFLRRSSLRYDPDPNDDAQFVFYPDTTNTFNLAENRSANVMGLKLDYESHLSSDLVAKVGTLSSFTTGHEDFSTFNASGAVGPQSNSNLSGHDLGVYGQTAYTPVEWLELRSGIRYDAHTAPFVGTQSQWSPRVRLSFFPSASTTAYLYYGRLFMPTGIEDLRAITRAAQGGEVDQGTLPERDNFFEAGLIRRFPRAGVIAKLSAYHKHSSPGIDDNTVPGSSIVTDVNIAEVRITGLETVLEFRPSGPLSGYLNAALNHAYGIGTITGGFFPDAPPSTSFFDLDHDQRLSIVGSATYSPGKFFVSATGIYGSGLTNGVDAADCGCSVGRGLFDFNDGIHVDPNTVFNLGAGYTFVVGRTVLQPELYVENAFNKQYFLKGAFFSGASIGRPRSVQVRLKATF